MEKFNFARTCRNFLQHDFDMDCSLKSMAAMNETIDLLRTIQQVAESSDLKLHELATNSPTVRDSLSVDRAKRSENPGFRSRYLLN